ncbi:MAG: alkaline phosphatase family protein [Bacteroidia bacterium]|nr:alkaline phosphatase family protein [Bacteroidia bacterium]MDW8133834.1 alkaline phosphatase family protein [Bacteroidia bacterium]
MWALLEVALPSPPRLVVGIIVDQMRADYLNRFVAKRSQGFGRLLSEGLVYLNCHYPYFPTYTGPGHASVYTGTTPAYHGIVANHWWDRQSQQRVYCVKDTAVRPVGTSNPAAACSPRALWSTTICDEARYKWRFRNKSIGIALKDRSAILSIGRSGTLALWFDTQTGRWVTSSYYIDTLPSWVEKFNQLRLPDSLRKIPWNRKHTLFCQDDAPFEYSFGESQGATFPHYPTSYEEMLLTPAGNWLTFRLAREAIEAEKLGKGPWTDFLAISLSTPDLVGHLFGTESCELEEIYRELDRQLADFLNYLTRRFRKEDIILFLTADHGAAPTPEFFAQNKLNAGRYPEKELLHAANNLLQQTLGLPDTFSPISALLNQNFYLSSELSYQQKEIAMLTLKKWLLTQPYVVAAYTAQELSGVGEGPYAYEMIRAGFLASRSGDVIVVYAPGWVEGGYSHGTTHGSIWSYDTHVPLIWWGGGIRGGKEIYDRVSITSIAATLAFILGTPLPSAAVSQPLGEVISQRSSMSYEFEWLNEGGGGN